MKTIQIKTCTDNIALIKTVTLETLIAHLEIVLLPRNTFAGGISVHL